MLNYKFDQSYDTASESDLIQRTKEGEVEAFGWLVNKYKKKIYTLAFQMAHNHADADVISQEAFIKAFECLDQFKGNSSFFTWLYRIALNQCFTQLKKRQRVVGLPDPQDEDRPCQPELAVLDPSDRQLEEKETQRIVCGALSKLTEEIRVAVVLVYLQDMTPKEAAKELGCAEATIHWRMFKARKVLKRLLVPLKG